MREAYATRPVVHVEPAGVAFVVEPGETIIEAAWRLGFHWPTTCYGQATCTSCAVEVITGDEHLSPVGHDERDALEHRLSGAARRDPSRIRLACRAQPLGDVTVHRPGVRPPQPEP